MDLFFDVATQWRSIAAPEGATGMVSAIYSRIVRTGFDYAGVESTLRMRGVPRRKHSALLSDLQVMERAALDEMRNQRDAESPA